MTDVTIARGRHLPFGTEMLDHIAWLRCEAFDRARSEYMAGYAQLGQWLASLFEGWAL